MPRSIEGSRSAGAGEEKRDGQNLTCGRFGPVQVFEVVYRQVSGGVPLYFAGAEFGQEEIEAHLKEGDCPHCTRWARNARVTCQRLQVEGKLEQAAAPPENAGR